MGRALLFEVGTEEIPARFMEGILGELSELARHIFENNRLSYDELQTYGTPRRVVLYVWNMGEEQKEGVREVRGPAARVAFDEHGQPTKAAIGFSRSQGVSVEELEVRDTPQGKYVYAIVREKGRPTPEVLKHVLPEIVARLSFEKPMRWGQGEFKFVRPVRWVVAMWGQEVIPLELFGVKSGNITWGHRFLSSGPVEINAAEDYFSVLREAKIIVDHRERKELIKRLVQEAAHALGGMVGESEDLINEVNFLVEYPLPVVGSFPEDFLSLPREVLVTPMREHQRYFPVFDQSGRLLSKFIAVSNGTADVDTVAKGNEKVLRARLEDARFFYGEDLKEPLEKKVDRLKEVVFLEGLGTLYDKTQRIRTLAAFIAQIWDLPGAAMADLDRAAYLCKADLVTNMVYEFPELQGVMGSYYAAAQGEREAVTQGIREHYQPRFMGDKVPKTPIGRILALADKIDTLGGCFAVGIKPSGSQDPYGLRRLAAGVCHILISSRVNLPLSQVVSRALELFGRDASEVEDELMRFLAGRLANILEEEGIRYDVIAAVQDSGGDDVYDVWQRAKALEEFRSDPRLLDLVTAFGRAYNLAREWRQVAVKTDLFESEVEYRLYDEFQRASREADRYLAGGDFKGALRSFASLKPAVDAFFDGVMVMVENEEIRSNRLSLLKLICDAVQRIGNVSKLVIT